jgi:hypothetical protein
MINSFFTMSAAAPSGTLGDNIVIGDVIPAFNAGVATANNLSGSNNVFIGNGIGTLATAYIGYGNTGVGNNVLAINNSGFLNTAVGQTALFGLRSGSYNTVLGASAMDSLTIGSSNVAIGYQAARVPVVGSSVTGASGSVFIGTDVRPVGLSPLNQIIIGDRAAGNGNNSVVLGNDNIAITLLKGNVSIGNTAPTHSLTVQGFVTASAFTGSFRGDGSGLTGVTATAAPGGVNTTVQFNDAGTVSGSTSFTFTKATNTVQIQGSGSVLLRITGSRGDILRIMDSGSSSPVIATISSGSTNVYTFTTSSLLVTGSVNASIETDALHYGRIVVTPATNQNNYSPTGWNDSDPFKATTININNSNSIVISGLAGGVAGRLAVLKNASPDRLIILEDSSSLSTASNRFDFRNPIFLLVNGSVTLLYDGVDSLWQPLATSGGIGYGAFFDLVEDFLTVSSTFNNTTTEVGRLIGAGSGTGAQGQTVTTLVNTTERPLGVYEITTGTTTTGKSTLGTGTAVTYASIIPTFGQAIFLCRIAVGALSTATDEYQIYAGFQDAFAGTNVTDGVYWVYNRVASTSWQGATAAASTRTTTGAAGPTVDTTFIWLGIYINPTWTRATYFYSQNSLNWTIAGEQTTNLPTSAQTTGMGVVINKSAGTVSTNCLVDFIGYRYDITRG